MELLQRSNFQIIIQNNYRVQFPKLLNSRPRLASGNPLSSISPMSTTWPANSARSPFQLLLPLQDGDNDIPSLSLLRDMAWDEHPLGHPAGWPSVLEHTVQTVLDNAQPMALWWGAHRACFYNAAFLQLIGPGSHPALLAAPMQQLHDPVWQLVGDEVRQVMDGGPAALHEAVPVARVDGEVRWWTYAISPLRQDGVTQGALLTCVDVTASSRSEVKALGARDIYRTVLDTMDDAFAVIEVLRDAQGQPVDYRWLEVNAAHAAHTGLHDVAGRRASECLSQLNPDVLQHYGDTASTGQRRRFTIWYDAMARWLEYCLVPVGRAGEEKVAVLARDVTTETQLRAALEESERLAVATAHGLADERLRLETILQAVPVPLFTAEATGAVVPRNALAAAQMGAVPARSQAEYAQWRGWWPATHAKAGQRLQPADWPIALALSGQACHQELIEWEVPRGGGPRRSLLVSAEPIRNSLGAITGAIAASIDVTEQARARAELEAASQRKDHFLAMLAHELRNPLAPLRTAATLLTHRPPAPEIIRRCGEIITRQVSHLSRLVDELNDVSRVTRGLAELQLREVDLLEVLHDAIEQISSQIEARGHRLTIPPAKGPIGLEGDPQRLVQVFSNLLGNAARYTPAGGTIAIGVETAADHVRVTVRDSGIGMSAEFIAHAFEMFSQASRSMDIQEGGLGIGLALVKSLVEMHGGSVEASSPGHGQGSCFTVRLMRKSPGAA